MVVEVAHEQDPSMAGLRHSVGVIHHVQIGWVRSKEDSTAHLKEPDHGWIQDSLGVQTRNLDGRMDHRYLPGDRAANSAQPGGFPSHASCRLQPWRLVNWNTL